MKDADEINDATAELHHGWGHDQATNGYRAMWAAEGETDIRTVVDTARLRAGTNTFQTILKTVSV